MTIPSKAFRILSVLLLYPTLGQAQGSRLSPRALPIQRLDTGGSFFSPIKLSIQSPRSLGDITLPDSAAFQSPVFGTRPLPANPKAIPSRLQGKNVSTTPPNPFNLLTRLAAVRTELPEAADFSKTQTRLDALFSGGRLHFSDSASGNRGSEGTPDPIASRGSQPNVAQQWTPDLILEGQRLFFPHLGNADGPAPVAILPGRASRRRHGSAVAWARHFLQLPPDEQIIGDVRLSPLTLEEREAAILQLLFSRASVAPGKVIDLGPNEPTRLDIYNTVIRQDVGRGRHNIYVVQEGRNKDVFNVVGAHHDKVARGHGTIDNWAGAVAVIDSLRSRNGSTPQFSTLYILFAREEEGLIGSELWLKRLPDALKRKIAFMINVDTIAVDSLLAWVANSDKPFNIRSFQVARAQNPPIPLEEGQLSGGDSDSSSFRSEKIIAGTYYGFRNPFGTIHTDRDTFALFSLGYYKAALQQTLAMLQSLDENPILGPDGRPARSRR